jgi:F-box-like
MQPPSFINTSHENCFNSIPNELKQQIFTYLPPNSLKLCLQVSKEWGNLARDLVYRDQRIRFIFFMEVWLNSLDFSNYINEHRIIQNCVYAISKRREFADKFALQEDIINRKFAMIEELSHLNPLHIGNVVLLKTPIPNGFEDFKTKIFVKMVRRRLCIEDPKKRADSLAEIVGTLVKNNQCFHAFQISHRFEPLQDVNMFISKTNCLIRIAKTYITQHKWELARMAAEEIPEELARQDLLEDIAKASKAK